MVVIAPGVSYVGANSLSFSSSLASVRHGTAGGALSGSSSDVVDGSETMGRAGRGRTTTEEGVWLVVLRGDIWLGGGRGGGVFCRSMLWTSSSPKISRNYTHIYMYVSHKTELDNTDITTLATSKVY